MKIRINSKCVLFLGSLVIAVTLLQLGCHAYDRKAASDYGIYWGGKDPQTGEDRRNPKYQNFETDCANFVSQCLIAGGIRFRSISAFIPGINDNTFNPGFGIPEQDTGYETTYMYDGDRERYSRTIPAANDLPLSLKHERHSSPFYRHNEYYGSAQLGDNGSLWEDVEGGDVCFQWNGESYFHCMLISSIKTSSPKDLLICGHNNQQSDEELLGILPGWKDGGVKVICLPDAPLVETFGLWSGGNLVTHKWSTKWKRDTISNAGPYNLVIKLIFDTDMNVNDTPIVQLWIGDTYRNFKPQTASGFNNQGWWVDPSNELYVKNRTWKGTVFAPGTPNEEWVNILPSCVMFLST